MKYMIVGLLFFLVAVTGCTAVKVLPVPVDSGVINTAENSQTVTKNGIEIKVFAANTEINAYNLEGTVTSFHLDIRNNTKDELAFSKESFVLLDESGLQYEMLTPEKVRDIIKKDSYYLMPYPYVGFYYQEDFVKTNFYNKTTSMLPYYYELYPQDIFTRSLPLTAIIPGMKVEGLVYFKVDLAARKQVKLYVYRSNTSKSSPPDFIFPFNIMK